MKKCNLIQNQPLPCQSFKEPLNPRTYTQNYTPHYDTRGDPLQIGGRGGAVIQTLRQGGGGGGLPKNFFRPFGPHFGRKIRKGGVPPWAPPLDPPLPLPRVFDMLRYLEAILPSLKSL